MLNQMQTAFSRLHNLPPMFKAILSKNVRARTRHTDRGWDARLSFKTYRSLKFRGVMA